MDNPLTLQEAKDQVAKTIECTECGWTGTENERSTKQDDVWTTYICPECSCESFYNLNSDG